MISISKHKDKFVGILISLIFIFLIVWNLDIKQLISTFRIFNYKILFVFVPLYVFSLYLRGYRWKQLLCNVQNLSVTDAFLTFTAGNALNSYLPARAGDFWRAYHIGNKLNESKMKILGSVILERIMDGLSVLLILLFAVLTYFKKPWVLNIVYISSSLFVGSFIFFFIVLKSNKIDDIFNYLSNLKVLNKFKDVFQNIAQTIKRFMLGFESLNNPKCFFKAFITSCLAWTIECVLTYLIISGFGESYGYSIAFFVISFIALSTIIPSSSIFVGPYQFAYILALGIYNIDKSNALAIAFIHQASIMLIITMITIIYFLFENINISKIKYKPEDE